MKLLKPKFSKVDYLLAVICKVLRGIVVTLLIILVLDIWFAVLDRYILGWQIVWTEAVARYLMMWAMFLSVPIIIARRQNISLTFLQDRLPANLSNFSLIVVNFLSTIFYSVVAYYGFSFVAMGENSISVFFGLPMTIAYYSIPVSFSIMTIVSLLILVKDFQKFKYAWGSKG